MSKSSRFKSWVLVIIQFVCLAGVALTGPLFADGVWFVLQIAGAGIGLWALWTMRRSRMNVLPDVRDGADLLRSGPYAYVRHPMYSGLILLTLAMLLSDFGGLRLAFWIVLVVNFDVKLRYEEGLLLQYFPAYHEYTKTTARLMPRVY